MPKMEKFADARARLLSELKEKGWKTSSPSLKVPWAEHPRGLYKLWFKPQAIYKDEHSTFLEMRGLTADALIAWTERTK